MGPITTISAVNKEKVGSILSGFLKDREIFRQEVNFMNPRPAKKTDNEVIPHDLYTASIYAGDSIPKESEIQKIYENTGLLAQCIGAFDASDQNRMSVIFMPGEGENVRVMAIIYSEDYKAPMNGLLYRIGLN